MQALLYRYTRRYNQRYRKTGHSFQGRHKAILCDRDSYLMVGVGHQDEYYEVKEQRYLG